MANAAWDWRRVAAWRGTVEDRSRVEWEASGVPSRFQGWRLDTSPLLKVPETSRLVAPLVAPADPEPGWWARSWYLWGTSGVGKTGLAVGYAYQWVDPGRGEPDPVLFWAVPDLLAALRRCYERRGGGGEEQILGRCREAALLVLDDLGAEHISGTGWVEDRLYQIIGHRHAHELATLFTSNLSPAELARHLGGVRGERLVWRIVEMCGPQRLAKVEGPNQRDRP